MKGRAGAFLFIILTFSASLFAQPQSRAALQITLPKDGQLQLTGLFYETAQGKVFLPAELTRKSRAHADVQSQAKMPDGRMIKLSLRKQGENYLLSLSAQP